MNVFMVLCSDWLVRVYDAGWQRLCWIFLWMSCGRKGVLVEKCSFPIFHHVFNTSVVDISCVWIGQMSHVTWHGVMSELRPGHGRHGPLEQGLWTGLDSGLGLDLWTDMVLWGPGLLIQDLLTFLRPGLLGVTGFPSDLDSWHFGFLSDQRSDPQIRCLD